MNYSTLTLTLSKEEARNAIAERVSGVKVKRSDGYYTYMSPAGFHLAELSDVTLPDGNQGSRLKYRIAMISPVAAPARSKARQIKRAVEKYRYRR